MALEEPDPFSAGPDGAAVTALLSAIPKPPTGRPNNVISGAFPLPQREDDGSERRKEITQLKEQKTSLENRLRAAFNQNQPKTPLQSTTPSLARKVIERYSTPSRSSVVPGAAVEPALPAKDNMTQPVPGDPASPLPAEGPPETGGDPINMDGATPDIINPGLPAPEEDEEDLLKSAY